MVNVKLSIAFVIAAAAVAPILAQPIALEGELLETREPQKYHNHRRYNRGPKRHHPKRVQVAVQTPDSAPPAEGAQRREFVDEEFEARALNLKEEKSSASLLQNRVKSLEKEDKKLSLRRDTLKKDTKVLQKTDDGLKRTEKGLKSTNNRLKKDNDGLTRTKHSLEKQDGALKREKGHLKGDVRKRKDHLKEDRSLGRKHKHLEKENKKHGKAHGKHQRLEKENKKHGKADGKHQRLEKENKKLGKSDGKPIREGRRETPKKTSLKTEGESPEKTVKTERKAGRATNVGKAKITPREFDEEVFERDFDETEFEARDIEESEFEARDFEEVEFEAREFDDELYLD